MTNAEKQRRKRARAKERKLAANPKFMMRARLAKRDLDYAESGCASRVVVDCVKTTDGRTLVVETRGRCCIAPHVTHYGW